MVQQVEDPVLSLLWLRLLLWRGFSPRLGERPAMGTAKKPRNQNKAKQKKCL